VSAAAAGERTTISLDGDWEIADSVAADALPSAYHHRGPVPGLAHSATPPFPDVDKFDSRELIQNRVSAGLLPKSALAQTAGVSRQKRNWFWYRRHFALSTPRAVAILRINKAQFGAALWVNGRKIGEHFPCFTAAIFDVSAAVHPGSNELIVRVGAHPGVLPATVTAGTDFEKLRWTPGIYDSISLQLSDNPAIETVQVAPRIADSSLVVQTRVRNYSSRKMTFSLTQRIHPWREQRVIGAAAQENITLSAGEQKIVLQSVRLPGARLWWPEDPHLYVVETSTGGDSASTRFGMRELRFDNASRRAWLNGRPYLMRGSNITLHRFFEGPHSGTLPWNEAWVRRLLVDIPKQMHWNSFRFCIGPVPDKWLDIADEAGLLIQNEYFVWTGDNWHGTENQVHFDVAEMIREYSEWMRDNWNHPSVVIWDANNETKDPIFGDKVIPAVRGLDLSNRPWENSYNPPAGPSDPVEDHPYEFQKMAGGGPDFSMTTLEKPGGLEPSRSTDHAMILNEYGWLWLNRDGSPTELTKKLYPRLLGRKNTTAERRSLDAYLLAGITEYWRASRLYAGVLHFVYLTSCEPGGYTCDNFRDVQKLELDPDFRDYMSNAFAPLGVNLRFWHPALKPGETVSLPVVLTNDDPHPAQGTLAVVLESASGSVAARRDTAFSIPPLGQRTYIIDFPVPRVTGAYILKAAAAGVQSRRRVRIP